MLNPAFLDEELCAFIGSAGCRQLFFGLESVGPRTLQIISKDCNEPKILDRILRNTAAGGILNYLYVLLGIPGTPEEEEEDTIRYLVDCGDVHVATVGSFVADMHSPMHVSPAVRAKYGVKLFSIGDMTTEFGYRVNGRDERAAARARVASYIEELYTKRPDLAIMSTLNDELRFVLATRFGSTFAQDVVSKHAVSGQLAKEGAILKAINERVNRSLGADDAVTTS